MTKEAFIAAAVGRYEKLNDLNKIDNFYDYEKKFEQIMERFRPGGIRAKYKYLLRR